MARRRRHRTAALSDGPQLELISVAELAARLKVSPRTIARHVASGLLPAVRVGQRIRFDMLAVKAALLRGAR